MYFLLESYFDVIAYKSLHTFVFHFEDVFIDIYLLFLNDMNSEITDS